MAQSRRKYRLSSKRRRRAPLGRHAWLDAARRALIEEGTAGIEVNKLAKRLSVSRGGFYWFFRDRQQLLDDLLQSWANAGTIVYERVLQAHPKDGRRQYQALSDMWIDEIDYDPRWDGAVRDWARTSAVVQDVVRAVDDKRIEILRKIFLNMDFKGLEATMRARITYYHQVGYYAIGVSETRERRLELLPYYHSILTGNA